MFLSDLRFFCCLILFRVGVTLAHKSHFHYLHSSFSFGSIHVHLFYHNCLQEDVCVIESLCTTTPSAPISRFSRRQDKPVLFVDTQQKGRTSGSRLMTTRRECTEKGLEVLTHENGTDMKGASVEETTSAGFNQTNCRCNIITPSAEWNRVLFYSLSSQIAPQKSLIIIKAKETTLVIQKQKSETGTDVF